jgi:hypothetical protein
MTNYTKSAWEKTQEIVDCGDCKFKEIIEKDKIVLRLIRCELHKNR